MRGIPITIIVGRDGREAGRVIGSIEFDQDKFISLLEKIWIISHKYMQDSLE